MSAAKKINHSLTQEPQANWNYRVLAVDDEVEIAKIYQNILSVQANKTSLVSSRSNVVSLRGDSGNQDYRFQVDLAHSYEDAVKLFLQAKDQGRPYAMGFFDVRLGGEKDGVQLVKELFGYDNEFMAVFVTAHSDRSLESFEQVLGSEHVDRWDYVNKPFIPNEVIQQARARVALWNLRREREGHAQKLEDLNRRVQESERLTSVAAVARGVAHEFGNLLMQIVGKAEISRNKSPQEMQKALDQIISASQHASEILDRFHNLSDHKASQIGKRNEDLRHVIDGAYNLISHQFTKYNIEFVYRNPQSVRVDIHETSLLQVFVNLFINAVHAMQKTGGKLFVDLTSDSQFANIKIRDTGPGVELAHLSKISEPFYTTKGSEGTGLGLSICKEIIEIDHRGEFLLGNHQEGGFEIQIKIPIHAEENS